jgi:Ca2+:H+ antiporter
MPSSKRDEQAEEKDDDDDVCKDGFAAYWSKSINVLLFSSPMNILLICCPIAFWGEANEYSDAFVFTTSLLAIAPFAERLSFVTEQLALHTSATLGGLLNASFGNVVTWRV